MRAIDLPIDEVAFSARAYNVLSKLGCRTLGDVTTIRPRSLAIAKNCGRRTTEEIQNVLARYGLRLNDDTVDALCLATTARNDLLVEGVTILRDAIRSGSLNEAVASEWIRSAERGGGMRMSDENFVVWVLDLLRQLALANPDDPVEMRSLVERARSAVGEGSVLDTGNAVARLYAGLAVLRPREEAAIRMRFGIGQRRVSLDDLATAFGVSRERARQIEMQAVLRLRPSLGLVRVATRYPDREKLRRAFEDARERLREIVGHCAAVV
ncbi:MAG: DNA-directed RNA polymerase subunit alpha C-terminal domain-containing protein [Candidatus Binatia bacterium]